MNSDSEDDEDSHPGLGSAGRGMIRRPESRDMGGDGRIPGSTDRDRIQKPDSRDRGDGLSLLSRKRKANELDVDDEEE